MMDTRSPVLVCYIIPTKAVEALEKGLTVAITIAATQPKAIKFIAGIGDFPA